MVSDPGHHYEAVTSRKTATTAPAKSELPRLVPIKSTGVRLETDHLFMKTIPRSPSTLSLSPVLIFLVAC